MLEERWLPIPDWSAYAISSHGNVKRLAACRGAVPGRILKSAIYPGTGYRYVVIQQARQKKHFLIHRLVALAFLGPPPSPTHQCNHRNGDKRDNRVENLEWVTHAENGQHAYRLGMTKRPPVLRGEASTSATITAAVAQAILNAPRGYGTGVALAKQFGTTEAVVSFIRTRRTWKHLTYAAGTP